MFHQIECFCRLENPFFISFKLLNKLQFITIWWDFLLTKSKAEVYLIELHTNDENIWLNENFRSYCLIDFFEIIYNVDIFEIISLYLACIGKESVFSSNMFWQLKIKCILVKKPRWNSFSEFNLAKCKV